MYVALEGIDTCGKSTQMLALKAHFPQAIFTKEPGGSALGEKVREIILQAPESNSNAPESVAESKATTCIDSGVNSRAALDSRPESSADSAKSQAPHSRTLSKEAEFFLFLADRAEHIDKVIKPNAHSLIISDRSLISGIAYASGIKDAKAMNLISTQGIIPNLCFCFHIDEHTLAQRLGGKPQDSIESRGIAYLLAIQERIIATATSLAAESSMRMVAINAAESIESITQQIVQEILQAFKHAQ